MSSIATECHVERADFDLQRYRGQFVLARSQAEVPAPWQQRTAAGWHLAVNDLPVHSLTHRDKFLGWCVGHPLGDGAITVDPNDIDAFYARFGGCWILLLVGIGKIHVDPGAQLPVVYATDAGIVASTPTLIPCAQARDAQLEEEVGFPDRDGWFPFGLTSRANVRRLLPNHSLDLERWVVTRHWPTPATDLSIHTDVKPLVASICADLGRTLRAARHSTPLDFSITAGHDSRMVLACGRDLVPTSSFLTYSYPDETCDMHIARRLAKLCKLDHRFIPFVSADADEMAAWMNRTGHAVSGAIMKIHPTFEQLEPRRALVTGIGGEIGRSIYYRRGDYAGLRLTADLLLRRLGRPAGAHLLEAGARWLDGLRGHNAFEILDLLYIENRFACWAAPQRFSNVTSQFEFTPFNHRKVIETILHLPHYYRWRDRLPYGVMRHTWPELRRVPVNRYTRGWKGMRDGMIALARRAAGPVRYRGGEL